MLYASNARIRGLRLTRRCRGATIVQLCRINNK